MDGQELLSSLSGVCTSLLFKCSELDFNHNQDTFYVGAGKDCLCFYPFLSLEDQGFLFKVLNPSSN